MSPRSTIIKIFKYLIAFLIPAIFVILIDPQLDNDSWGVIAEGRYIIENGLYYHDPLSIHNTPIVVPNYAFAVCFYLIHSVFGAPGIYITMLLLNFIICFLLYKICLILSKKNINLSLIIMLVTDLFLATNFVVTRAQMVTFVIFLSLIYVLELYISTNKSKYLWWLPLLSLIQINFHASYWWVLIVTMLPYIIDSFRDSNLHLQGYRTKPLIFAFLGMLAVCPLNPYGFSMIISIFTVYFNSNLNSTVRELQPFRTFAGLNPVYYLAIFITSFLYLFGPKKHLRIRFFLMYFGFLALGLNTIKALSQFILVMFFPLASSYQKSHPQIIDHPSVRHAFISWAGILSICLFVTLLFIEVFHVQNYPDLSFVAVMDSLDASTANTDKSNLKIYTDYGSGGYVQYRGYKTYLDPRGDTTITKEWVDFNKGKITPQELFDKYHFDYLLVRNEEDPFYQASDLGCQKIYEDVESTTLLYNCQSD